MIHYLIYKIGQIIALYLPLRLAYKVAVVFSDLHYLFAWRDRRNVAANLEVIFPQKTKPEIRRIRKIVFRNFAKYLVDFFRFKKLNRDYVKENVHFENLAYLDSALDAAKGVIILTAHIGNWELGGVAVAIKGYPIAAVALPHRHKKVDMFFNSQRESSGLRVIPLGQAARDSLKALRQNQIIALVGDRDFTNKGEIIDFLGMPTYLPEGPAVFSLKTGASILPVFVLRESDDTFTLKFEKPIEFNPTGDKINDRRNLIFQYKLVIEDYIRHYPEQWLMFRRFWAKQ